MQDSAPDAPGVSATPGGLEELRLRRQREQLMVLARRLAGMLH